MDNRVRIEVVMVEGIYILEVKVGLGMLDVFKFIFD